MPDARQSKILRIDPVQGYPQSVGGIVGSMHADVAMHTHQEVHVQRVYPHAAILVNVGRRKQIAYLAYLQSGLLLYLAAHALLHGLLHVAEAARQVQRTLGRLFGPLAHQQPTTLVHHERGYGSRRVLVQLEATKKANEAAGNAGVSPANGAGEDARAPLPIKETVSFEEFEKLDIRVGLVKDCQKVKKSKKLLQFTIDDGSGRDRTICSGIAAFYENPEELIGKRILFVANFAPRAMMGIESQGMILSAVDADDSLSVVTTTKDVKPGSQVG